MAFDPAQRSTAPELMDVEACDYETFRACLADLAFVNRVTFAHRPTLAFFERLRRRELTSNDRPLRVVDVGSGYGDMLRAVAGWAEQAGVAVELIGVDLNPFSARAAREATAPDAPIEWITGDVFAQRLEADVVISSLFTHHLFGDALPGFLRWMEASASLGWFVNDLRRSRVSYLGFTLGSRALRRHRFVQHDGPVSIARSFVPGDWQRTLAAAGLAPGAAVVEPWFPYRLCVSRVRER